MTKEEYKRRMCKSCINYCSKCKEEDIQERIEENTVTTICKNFHKLEECITKNCNACGQCTDN